jgi:hypothetical protein
MSFLRAVVTSSGAVIPVQPGPSFGAGAWANAGPLRPAVTRSGIAARQCRFIRVDLNDRNAAVIERVLPRARHCGKPALLLGAQTRGQRAA